MVFGIMTGLLRKRGSHTPAGNFSAKRGNKNFYKGKGANSYGKINGWGVPHAAGCSERGDSGLTRATPPNPAPLCPQARGASRACPSGTCPI